jgi:hypothetical protein
VVASDQEHIVAFETKFNNYKKKNPPFSTNIVYCEGKYNKSGNCNKGKGKTAQKTTTIQKKHRGQGFPRTMQRTSSLQWMTVHTGDVHITSLGLCKKPKAVALQPTAVITTKTPDKHPIRVL